MSARFADFVPRLASLAAQVLGWPPAEFWSATPAELAMALAAPESLAAVPPPSRETIARMMERDADD